MASEATEATVTSMIPSDISAHGYQHGFGQQYRPQTSKRLSVVAWTADILSLQPQDEPWTSTGPLAAAQTLSQSLGAAQAKDINMASGATGATDTNMVPVSRPTRGHQHSFRQQHRPRTPAWPSVVTRTRDINQHGLRWLHRPRIAPWPLVVTQATGYSNTMYIQRHRC